MARAHVRTVVVVLQAALLAFLVATVGGGIWNILLGANLYTSPAIPWSIPATALALWLLWHYLGGAGRPHRTAEFRRSHLRARRVPRLALGWALAAGLLSLVALAGLWIVLVDLTGTGGNPTIPSASKYPAVTVVLILVMASIVSPITEEAAFRGYCQVSLEHALPAAWAIGISSLCFMLWHGPTQGFFWSKLLFFLLVGVVFGTTAYLTNSVLPALPVHIVGDLTFFFLIWPNDANRASVWRHGTDLWFWLHGAQAVVFAAFGVVAFWRLAQTVAHSHAHQDALVAGNARPYPGVQPEN